MLDPSHDSESHSCLREILIGVFVFKWLLCWILYFEILLFLFTPSRVRRNASMDRTGPEECLAIISMNGREIV